MTAREAGLPVEQIRVVKADDPQMAPPGKPGTHLLNFHEIKDYQLPRAMFLLEKAKSGIYSLILRLEGEK